MKDLTGITFGRLTVLSKSMLQNKDRIVWHCICECGNHCDVESKNLLHGGTKSCGCLALESATQLASGLAKKRNEKSKEEISEMKIRAEETKKERHYINGVDTTALKQKIRTDNKSGMKGISYDKSRSKWKVEITVNHKKIFIGRFDSLEEASKARKNAETIHHEPIINKLNEKKR